MTGDYAVYLHIPFCLHRCAYCDFNTFAGKLNILPAYMDAMNTEIREVARSAKEKITSRSIFFGGGTPSLLPIRQFEIILGTIHETIQIVDPEISVEVNPGTVSLNYLCDLQALGVNRISFGVQSFHADELRMLERLHDPFDVFNAIKWARKAGFTNINLDLIFGLPGQTIQRWIENIKLALNLQPEHLSLYALTVEKGTPFGRWMNRGMLPRSDPDTAAGMYETASEILKASGYFQYEISNWAKSNFACQHNLQYWRNQPYLGFGAGAHGFAGGMRYANVQRINNYIDRIQSADAVFPFPLSPACVQKSKISPKTQMKETMMLGLRLTQEGINEQEFKVRFGKDPFLVFTDELIGLMRKGLLERKGSIIRLTPKGRLLGNQVFIFFV